MPVGFRIVLVGTILGSWLAVQGQPNQPSKSPEVIEALQGVEVVDIVDISYGYDVGLLNTSKRGICGVFSRESRGRQLSDHTLEGRVVPPGEILKLRVSQGPSWLENRVELVSVLFADGTCEGAKAGCARIEARREGRRLAATLELPILQQALRNLDSRQLLDDLSTLAIDGQARGKLIVRLAMRYPGRIEEEWEGVIEESSQEFRFQTGRFGRDLEYRLRPSSDEDVSAWIKQRIKQCEETIARELPFAQAVNASPAAASPAGYREAYEAWMNAALKWDISFWLHRYPQSPLSRPLVDVLEIGPNIAPFLVEELRKERDERRIFRLCTVMGYVVDIDVRRGKPFPSAGILAQEYPASREQFLADWDAGLVTNPTESLRNVRRNVDEDKPLDKIDYQGTLKEVRTYGVYALPFIVETLKQHNSDELFAAFLAVTAQYDLYSRYYEAPRELFVSQAEKFGYVQAWFKANEHRIHELKDVHAKLKKLLQEPASSVQ